MFLKRAVIENFRKIKHLIIEASGKHITIKGSNGAGKTTVFETLATALGGKKYLMPDAVQHGKEVASFKWEVSEGKDTPTMFEITGTIKSPGNQLALEVATFNPLLVSKKNPDGRVVIDSPVSVLERLAPKEFIDPLLFVNKDGAGRIAMLYKLLPGLKGAIDQLTKDYEAEQFKRSQINQDKRRIEVELEKTPLTEGVAEKEIDAADLLDELNAAREHNLQLVGFDNEIKGKGIDISVTEEMHAETILTIDNLEGELVKARERAESLVKQVEAYKATLADTEAKKATFQPKDEKEIESRIAGLNATNDAIRKNLKRIDLQKQLEAKVLEYSTGLENMKKIDDKKVAVYRDAHMPVAGLAVGTDDLLYPDPVTGEAMPFSRLSSGQQCRAAVEILAPFLPAPDKGLRCMLIANAESLDEANYKAVLEAADKNDIELVLHKTTWAAGELEVVIEGSEEKTE
jgi:energy-coupling factor transporter ATP-binding protein EcfA2